MFNKIIRFLKDINSDGQASKKKRKFQAWVVTSVSVFILCMYGFSSWIISDNGKPDFALYLTIGTFILWGIATSLGFKIGIYQDIDNQD